MSFNIILLKLMVLFVGLSYAMAAVINKDNENSDGKTNDLQTSATSAKLLNLGSWFGGGGGSGGNGFYPNNIYRPGCSTCYGYNINGGNYPNIGKYPATNYGGYYPNNNNYPTTNILGGSYGSYAGYGGYGGYAGYGGYGGNGGLRQYYGYYDPAYTGQRNLGYAYYTNTNNYGLPRATGDYYGNRDRDRMPYTFRGYD